MTTFLLYQIHLKVELLAEEEVDGFTMLLIFQLNFWPLFSGGKKGEDSFQLWFGFRLLKLH